VRHIGLLLGIAENDSEARNRVSPRPGEGSVLRRPYPQGREAPLTFRCIHPTKYELVINLKTAKALGPEVPMPRQDGRSVV
jgi:hypothetical protein